MQFSYLQSHCLKVHLMNTILLPTKKRKKRRRKEKEGGKEEKTSNRKQKTEYLTISTRLVHPWNCSKQEYWSGLPSPSPKYCQKKNKTFRDKGKNLN